MQQQDQTKQTSESSDRNSGYGLYQILNCDDTNHNNDIGSANTAFILFVVASTSCSIGNA